MNTHVTIEMAIEGIVAAWPPRETYKQFELQIIRGTYKLIVVCNGHVRTISTPPDILASEDGWAFTVKYGAVLTTALDEMHALPRGAFTYAAIERLREVGNLYLTGKFRAGWDLLQDVAVELTAVAESAGVLQPGEAWGGKK